MDGEITTPGQSSDAKNSLGVIHILVVDDDSTSLAVVAGLLKTWKYDVLTVKHPIDALATLRVKRGLIDLVVTDVHMPGMNGFELQKHVDEEFNLPVVMMSADDRESIILRGLQGGAVFFMVKPISPDDLKNIWQYTVASKKNKSGVVEETSSVKIPPIVPNKKPYMEIDYSTSSVNEASDEKPKRREYRRKTPKKPIENRQEEKAVDPKILKKPKVIWTTALHNRFLLAIRQIGLEKAVPKRILEFMNVPGLTRENVASHLQKYRIFLKRVTDISDSTSKSLCERALIRSSFSLHPALMLNSYQQDYPQFVEQPQMINAMLQPGLGGVNGPIHYKAPNNGSPLCHANQEAANSNSITPFMRGGQSSLLNSQTNLHHQSYLYPTKSPSLRLQPNSILQGGLKASTNAIQMHQPQAKARQEDYSKGPSSYMTRASNNNAAGIGNMDSFNSFQSFNNSNYATNNSAAPQGSNGGELATYGPIGIGHVAGEGSNNSGFGNDYYLMNEPTGKRINCGFDNVNPSPAFSNATQQESALVSSPPLPPRQAQNSNGNNGGDSNYVFGSINNTAILDNNSLNLQPFSEVDDLSDILMKQINGESANQLQGGKEILDPNFSISSYQVEENPREIAQTLNQQEGGQEGTDQKFDNNIYDFLSWFDPQPNQQINDEFVNSELCGITQPESEEAMDSLFGINAYLRD